jgi:membrane protein implicated in regulation of membrane protease activity
MFEWMVWLAFAGVLVVFELVTGTFYLLMIAIGMALGGVAAFAGLTLPAQFLVAAIVGIVATGLLHQSRFGGPGRPNAASDPNVNLDIGQTIRIDVWTNGHARALHRGALWDVDLAPGGRAEAGVYRIVELQGSRLIVVNT